MEAANEKPFPLLLTIISIACIVIMLLLGFWQLDRKAQKESRLAQIEQRSKIQTLSLDDIIDAPADYQDVNIEVQGKALNSLFYIDNKLHRGKAGYHLVQAIETNSGIVMVNLGWIAGTGDRQVMPNAEVLKGIVKQRGIVSIPSKNLFISETNLEAESFPVLLQQLDLDIIASTLDTKVLPFVLLAAPDEQSNFVREWKAVVMAPEKHLGYAVQWFGLAVAAMTIFLLSLGKYYKQPNVKDP